MLHKTNGIVLRSVKYGDTSLVTTVFTHLYGLQTYMVQGVRSTSPSKNRAAYFQPGMLLELVVHQQPLKNMQRIREYQAAYIYGSLRQDVVKNAIALFSVEILLRLLPEHAPMAALFDTAFHYFKSLDRDELPKVANYPLYFVIQCSRIFGYDIKGRYTPGTPHLDQQEGGFTSEAPAVPPYTYFEDAEVLDKLLQVAELHDVSGVQMNAAMRLRLTDWYISYLQLHTQHMGNIKSLTVLRTILH
jgi:DNA repair protein RecO (recombination protein O)